MKPLVRELDYFAENQAKWRENYPGKFVWVKERELIGTFDSADAALAHGARLFGTESFLVRRADEDSKDIYIPALALGLLKATKQRHSNSNCPSSMS